MVQELIQFFSAFFAEHGLSERVDWLATAAAIGVVIAVFFLCFFGLAFAVRKLLTLALHSISKRTKNKWDDTLCEKKFPAVMSHLLLAVLCLRMIPNLFGGEATTEKVLLVCANLYFAGATMGVLFAILNSFNAILENSQKVNGLPVKGFFQAVKLMVGLAVGIWMLSIISERSPMYFLSGLGAIMAVLLLVFRDTLLGFTAGIVISVNDLVRKKDWIEIPSLNVDGEVEDVSLTTVKVKNWDNTLSSVPAYSLISTSFKNWRAMTESGGRRIKRSIHIDMETIHFASESEIEHWKKIRILRPYLEQKLNEISEEKTRAGEDGKVSNANARHLTNIGTFRAYCVAYLKASSKISQGMTMLVRQLDLGAKGLPLEIYVFTNDVRWVAYEGIQSDIFDHLLAIMPEFNLRPFQEPSGTNFSRLAAAK